jgi:hypothetical protein
MASARRAIDYLRNGASALHKAVLRSFYVENRLPSTACRKTVLKTVEEWIKKGFVAGPFNPSSHSLFSPHQLTASGCIKPGSSGCI